MLEFAREQYLWLFALVALFFVAFYFARRFKSARVTYGFIWERAARQMRPPAWKRLLRLLLTLLVSAAMLSSAALYAAGLGPAPEARPAPLTLFIVEDNSPSMRARISADKPATRNVLARQAAQRWLAALGENDRALTIHFVRGRPVGSAWMKAGDALRSEPPPTDFAKPDLDALASLLAGAGAPPDIPAVPKPQPLLLWLGDRPPAFEPQPPPPRLAHLADSQRFGVLAGVPVLAETFGAKAENEAVVEAAFKPAPSGSDFFGTLEGRLRSGGAAHVEITSYAESGAVALFKQATPYRVPLTGRRRVALAGPAAGSAKDVFAWDDEIECPLQSRALGTVVIVRPRGEAPNPVLREGLELLLPGRTFDELEAGTPVSADVVVLDRAPVEAQCRLLLCFGALPPSMGEVLGAREAKAGLFDAFEKLPWLGFEVPNLQLLAGRETFALKPGHKLTPLATHIEAGVLIAAAQGERDVLYVGFSPTQSNFLFTPEGPTLLQRWLGAAQGKERQTLPPLCRMDQSVEFKLASAAVLRVKLARGWGSTVGALEYDVIPAPDGRVKIGPFEQPGVYELSQPGALQGALSVYWVDEGEQALPYQALAPVDTSRIGAPREHTWRDWFPDILLWIAGAALLLEWLLWLAGWTD